MRNSISVANINGAIGQDRTEEHADDAVGLVRASNVAIADVEDDQRVNLRGQARRGRSELQNDVLARRHSL